MEIHEYAKMKAVAQQTEDQAHELTRLAIRMGGTPAEEGVDPNPAAAAPFTADQQAEACELASRLEALGLALAEAASDAYAPTARAARA